MGHQLRRQAHPRNRVATLAVAQVLVEHGGTAPLEVHPVNGPGPGVVGMVAVADPLGQQQDIAGTDPAAP